MSATAYPHTDPDVGPRWCRPCNVTWTGSDGDTCWCCGGAGVPAWSVLHPVKEGAQ